ncbi:MAG: ribosomal protein S18-alanine N-acetyltransferase [Eubacteriales bacterium]
MNIRKADLSSLPALLAIENEAFTCPWSERSFREALASPDITVYIAEDEDTVLGFACVLTLEGEGELLNLAVRVSSRRTGVGQRLMDTLLTESAENGVRDFYLEVRESNTAARHLYEKNGFVPLGVRKRYYTKPTEDAVVMRRHDTR